MDFAAGDIYREGLKINSSLNAAFIDVLGFEKRRLSSLRIKKKAHVRFC
jgi:hypothetical protein